MFIYYYNFLTHWGNKIALEGFPFPQQARLYTILFASLVVASQVLIICRLPTSYSPLSFLIMFALLRLPKLSSGGSPFIRPFWDRWWGG